MKTTLTATPIPQDAGYVFNFSGHGAFDPHGRVSSEPSEADVAQHNRALALRQVEEMKRTGRGVLYLHVEPNTLYDVRTWDGSVKFPAHGLRKSWHNMAGKDGRTDVWFTFDGSAWHGVSIGDNDMLRVRRTKGVQRDTATEGASK